MIFPAASPSGLLRAFTLYYRKTGEFLGLSLA